MQVINDKSVRPDDFFSFADLEIIAKTRERMNMMQLLIEEVFNPKGSIRSLIVSGSPGIGKTYAVNQIAAKYPDVFVKSSSGHITPLKLFQYLQESVKDSRDTVLVFDDADDIFNKIEGLNVLKGCMDPEKGYRVVWRGALVDEFEFKGKIIILTNAQLHKWSAHYQAFLDRTHYLPVWLSEYETYLQVAQYAISNSVFIGLSANQALEIVLWLKSQLSHISPDGQVKPSNLRERITYRTFTRCSELVRSFGDNWQKFAKVTLCK